MDIRREGTPEEENELDFSQFDSYQVDRIAKATLNLVWRIIQQPGGRQRLEEKKKQLREKAATADM